MIYYVLQENINYLEYFFPPNLIIKMYLTIMIICEFIQWKLHSIQDSFPIPWNKIVQYLELEAINVISILSMKYK